MAASLWMLLTYVIFTAFTIKQKKPSLPEGINGGWLLAVVATEAVSQLATLLSSAFPGHSDHLLFAALCLWLSGGMLYIWMISLIFYRYTAPSGIHCINHVSVPMKSLLISTNKRRL